MIIPLSHDQFDNAERIKALGVGARLDATRVTPPRLAQALQTLLDGAGLRAHCQRVAARFDDGAGFAAACVQLVLIKKLIVGNCGAVKS